MLCINPITWQKKKKSNLHRNCFPKPHNKQVSSDQLFLSLAEIKFTLQILLTSFPLCLHFTAAGGFGQVGKGHPRHPQVPWLEHSPSPSSVSCSVPDPRWHQATGASPDWFHSSLETSLPPLGSLKSASGNPRDKLCVPGAPAL